jgi:hypothetical protein
MRDHAALSPDRAWRSSFSGTLPADGTKDVFVPDADHIRLASDFLDVAKCRVYRFEDGLDTIMADLAARWDVPPPDLTLHENATRKIRFEIGIATRHRIDAFYAEDFERLGYPTAVARA